MVKVGERRGGDEKNPYNAIIIPVSKLLGTQRHNFERTQTTVPDEWRKQLEAGKFRRIEHQGNRHMMFQSGESLYPENSAYLDTLTTSIQNLPVISE